MFFTVRRYTDLHEMFSRSHFCAIFGCAIFKKEASPLQCMSSHLQVECCKELLVAEELTQPPGANKTNDTMTVYVTTKCRSSSSQFFFVEIIYPVPLISVRSMPSRNSFFNEHVRSKNSGGFQTSVDFI